MNHALRGRLAQSAGRCLEDRLEEQHALYAKRGTAWISRTDAYVIRGKGGRIVNAHETGADFHGTLAGGRAVALEAKSLRSGLSLPWSRFTDEQIDDLTVTHRMGGCAFVFVDLNGRYLVVPWPVAERFRGTPSICLATRSGRSAMDLTLGVRPCPNGDWLAVVMEMATDRARRVHEFAATAAGGA